MSEDVQGPVRSYARCDLMIHVAVSDVAAARVQLYHSEDRGNVLLNNTGRCGTLRRGQGPLAIQFQPSHSLNIHGLSYPYTNRSIA